MLAAAPVHYTHWPECAGKCIRGGCALRWDTPACCYLRRQSDDRQHDDRWHEERDGHRYVDTMADELSESDELLSMASAADSDTLEVVPVTSEAYWHSKDWYCRR